LTWLEGQTWRDLHRAIRRGQWHVFHFIGHGGFNRHMDEGFLALADDTGRAHLIGATELSRLLDTTGSLRLAVLNSCEGAHGSTRDVFSSTAATLVRRGLPAVLAMQYEISDWAAIEFGRAFYEALADGLPVDAATTEARTAVSIAVTDSVEWGTPVLFTRAPDGVLFRLERPAGDEMGTGSARARREMPDAAPSRSTSSGLATAFELAIVAGPATGSVYPLAEGLVTIGRSAADIVVREASMSPHHFTLNWDGARGTFLIVDVGSATGTLVDGEYVRDSRALAPGQVITVGATRMVYRRVGLDDAIRPQQPADAPAVLPFEASGRERATDIGDAGGARVVGAYRLLERLGGGDLGAVYRAEHIKLGRTAAVQLLPIDLVHEREYYHRYEREMRATASLEHPNILPIWEYGEQNGEPYLVTPLLTGGNLAERLVHGPLPIEEALSLIDQLAAALDYAHARGAAHGFVQPISIRLDSRGRLYLADFGLARALEYTEEGGTRTGMGLGVPEYMAPEQAQGRMEARSDLYALGIILYQLLTGRVPYSGNSAVEVLMKHLQDPLPLLPLRSVSPPLPPGVEPVLQKALAKNPNDRFQTGRALAEAFRAVLAAGAEPRAVREQRRVDAAVPSRATVGGHIDLLVQVRLPDAPPLGRTDWPARHRPDAVEQAAEPLSLTFPVDAQTGQPRPARLTIRVVSPDFRVEGDAQKQVEVPPGGPSQRVLFLLTALRLGDCRINVEVSGGDQTYLGTIPLETSVAADGEPQAAPTDQVASLVFVIAVVGTPPLRRQTPAASTTPPPPDATPAPGGHAPAGGYAPGSSVRAPSVGAAPSFPLPANRPPAAAAGRKRGPLVGIVIALVVLIVIAIALIVLVARKVTSADLAPTANLALPFLAATFEIVL
ncbi:MAG TPA: protein kinase, partial [Thermomicrobiales bacterium]|nr:protein kinase [Thermomicrobiales bacterium]